MLRGLLMGDASVFDSGGRYPAFQLEMANREFLAYLSEEFGVLCRDVKSHRSAAEAARHSRENGANEDASAEDYSDTFSFNLRSHPGLEEFFQWYDSGEKVFPSDLELTPVVLKMWYVCDGSVKWGNSVSKGSMRIGVGNELENKSKLFSYFDGLDVSPRLSGWNLYFDHSDSVKLLEYIGSPLPGFGYKWRIDSKRDYLRLRD
ncbi:LAGLIDADG DNA endonuclease family protein [Haloarcula vallismortis]|uniref:Homing endonuclease LAGLIDADG domain-containing protein n=3 Tax=Haloarcula vallismortis TaxID=28442 RepID=M0JPR1_HALVA|nr:hypothetical protein [Haloarcula vallismortis]EMA09959.1 hypothetical protein C437_04860 [Haloarcula vallismortis ATCC 29715]SDX27735.1 LAGLIDADG DNA endonuclease family protein [Haloarcula vallismortis]